MFPVNENNNKLWSVWADHINRKNKMGCDIHVMTEYREPGKQSWSNADTFELEDAGTEDEYFTCHEYLNTGRNYSLFGLLSKGVRADYDLSLEAKGDFPSDTTEDVMRIRERWDSDGHSHSWLTLREIKVHLTQLTVAPNTSEIWGIEEYHSYKNQLEELKKEKNIESDDDIRILFFFDN